MAELKTKETTASVDKFISSINETQQADSRIILKMMSKATKSEPKMWGTSIVGFGFERLKYESGRELDWFKIGFSPRKQALTLYGLRTAATENPELFAKLGKHTEGKGCIYIKKLRDIDQNVLKEIIMKSV